MATAMVLSFECRDERGPAGAQTVFGGLVDPRLGFPLLSLPMRGMAVG